MARADTVRRMSLAKQERDGICDTLLELGPDEPTLCVGWTTRDMIAHLVLRERRPDAAVGILVRPFAGHTSNVMAEVAKQPFHELVATFRSGPPWWSVFAIPGVGDRANMFELYVHHEDVRRAQPDWQPRPSDVAREDALWDGLTNPMGRLLFRRSSVGVVLRAAGRQLFDGSHHRKHLSLHPPHSGLHLAFTPRSSNNRAEQYWDGTCDFRGPVPVFPGLPEENGNKTGAR